MPVPPRTVNICLLNQKIADFVYPVKAFDEKKPRPLPATVSLDREMYLIYHKTTKDSI